MTRLDHRTFVRLARDMAATNGYTPMQSSDLYPTDGDQIDWMYAPPPDLLVHVRAVSLPQGHHDAPDASTRPTSASRRETRRNREAVLYLLEHGRLPLPGHRRCGGLVRPVLRRPGDRPGLDGSTPTGPTRATAGRWSRGIAKASPFQRDRGGLGPGGAGDRPAHGARTSTADRPRSAPPGSGCRTAGPPTLRLRYWVGLDAAAGPLDGLTVRLVDAAGAAGRRTAAGGGRRRGRPGARVAHPGRRAAGRVAGQRVAIELEARDDPGDGDATVEAAIDDPRVTLE